MQIFTKKKLLLDIRPTFFEEKIEDFLRNIIIDKDDYLKKEFKKIKLSNTWINVNEKY